MNKKIYDVIVAGGGPAGTTAATLLAQYGYQILLLDKDQHPRFHIGESMLPMSEPILQRLGVQWHEGNLRKGGAEFIDEKSGQRMFFPFQGNYSTVQVERSVFDERLYHNALKHGVEGHQQEKVTGVDCRVDGVTISSDKAQYQGHYFIDATGRAALQGRKNQSINKLSKLGKFALYKHYQLADTPASQSLFNRGHIEVILTELGWFWCIPLINNRLSIGLVVQKEPETDLKQADLFNHYAAASPRIGELLAGATLLADVRAEADFSYLNQQRHGVRFACCGDAAGFLDPVFSSGFFFAVKTAEMVADQLHQGFLTQQEATIDLHSQQDALYQKGFKTMYLMIERFYCSNLVHNLFFQADHQERVKNEITALLAGDLWQPDNRFQEGLLAGRFATMKDALV